MKKVLSDRIEYQNEAGQLHREDGPAVELNNGYKAWYVNGQLHRLDGPAREWNDGSKEWWVNGQLHRLDGPAIEWSDGGKSWYINGQLHRLDGPAVEWSNGCKAWWIHDVEFSQQEFEEHPLVLQEKQRKHDLEVDRIRNNKKAVSRWRLL